MENSQITKVNECDFSDVEANKAAFKAAYMRVMDDDITDEEIENNPYKTEMLDLCVQFAKLRLGLNEPEE